MLIQKLIFFLCLLNQGYYRIFLLKVAFFWSVIYAGHIFSQLHLPADYWLPSSPE